MSVAVAVRNDVRPDVQLKAIDLLVPQRIVLELAEVRAGGHRGFDLIIERMTGSWEKARFEIKKRVSKSQIGKSQMANEDVTIGRAIGSVTGIVRVMLEELGSDATALVMELVGADEGVVAVGVVLVD